MNKWDSSRNGLHSWCGICKPAASHNYNAFGIMAHGLNSELVRKLCLFFEHFMRSLHEVHENNVLWGGHVSAVMLGRICTKKLGLRKVKR
jgi:hypothetical protein